MLALMAVVGLAAVYFAKDQAEQSRIAGSPGRDLSLPDDGTGALNAFLGSFIYDEQDDHNLDNGRGLINAIRGHSLVRTMYGGKVGSTNAWDGVGTFGYSETVTVNGASSSRPLLVNHRLLPQGGAGKIFDPEYTNYRLLNANGTVGAVGSGDPGNGVTQQFFGKNAPYTYPDIKDFYLAQICPATGEVLVPSFHRDHVFGSLDPSNPKWRDGTGVVQTPRPTLLLNPNFPPVPPNADGTYSGDVQNLPGGFGQNGVARNDSIWIDIGLPAITLANGKRVKPLVAPLILDLDGRLNLNIHGNLGGGLNVHRSGDGIGPWEVSLSRVLGTEGDEIVRARGTPQMRAGGVSALTRAFANRYPTNAPLPQYGPVAWNGFTAALPLQLPGNGAKLISIAPRFTNGYDATNVPVSGHPSLYNPTEWPATNNGTTQAFPLADTKILTSSYAAYPHAAGQLSFANQAPGTLRGTANPPNPNPPNSLTTNFHRTDPAHANRQLVTTHSYALDRSALMPHVQNQPPGPNAAIGAINLNRPLADYRDFSVPANQLTPLSPTNIGNRAAADADRQRFAMDIFARLIVAAGIPATTASVDATTGDVVIPFGIAVPPGAPYNQLRDLAQLAVNMVDYIDNDDVITRFQWSAHGTRTDPFESTVFGVEQPRLVINEAYAELVNHPNDPENGPPDPNGVPMPPMNPGRVRFWVELLNPTNTAYLGGTGPLGTGAVTVGAVAPGVNPYQLEIVRAFSPGTSTTNPGVIPRLSEPGNTLGQLGTGLVSSVVPEIRLLFDSFPAVQIGPNGSDPNSVVYNPAGNRTQGVLLIGPSVNNSKKDEFDPAKAPAAGGGPPAPWTNMIPVPDATGGANQFPQNGLGYSIDLPAQGQENRADLKRHVILLRRLANPYAAFDGTPGTATFNPYITVDVMDWVPAFDALHRGMNQGMSRGKVGAANAMGYSSPDERFSVGKVQPFAGLSVGSLVNDPKRPSYTFPASMVQSQVTPQNDSDGNPTVHHTFGRHNGRAGEPAAATFTAPAVGPPTLSDTLMVPFEWQPHLDRPLINQLELLHVTTGKPHEFTQNFIRGNATSLTKHNAAIQTLLLGNTYPQLYRALDLLRVQAYGNQTALGGRIPGRININTIQDKRVWDALFDAPAAGMQPFDQTFVDAAWNQLMASRTRNMSSRNDANNVAHPCPIPGESVHDTGNVNADRPFLPFSVGSVTANPSANTLRAGTGLNDTLLRLNTTTNLPILTVTATTHPYQQAEAARKILNNVTTVSHTFAVWMTVGYFEVEAETSSGVTGVPDFTQLGKEYFRDAPGDTRHKFFAIVDRSNIGLEPINRVHATERPFFTTLEANAAINTSSLTIATAGPSTVYTDGVPVQFGDRSVLVVGTGLNQEIVTISGVPTYNGDGLTTVNLAAPLIRVHWAGESVSNVIPGNPGPQPNFNVNTDMYKPVVPHWSRLP